MVDRISALAGNYHCGKFGRISESDNTGVKLEEIPGLILHQIAAWPNTIEAVGQQAANMAESESVPGPCLASVGSKATLLRIEPLKWWLLGGEAPELESEQGATMDLSHSRTHIRISGAEAVTLLNRHLPLDLRENSFPVGSVASSAIHHVGVSLWRSAQGYELFIPRGFALSIWQGLVESAKQFGVEVV